VEHHGMNKCTICGTHTSIVCLLCYFCLVHFFLCKPCAWIVYHCSILIIPCIQCARAEKYVVLVLRFWQYKCLYDWNRNESCEVDQSCGRCSCLMCLACIMFIHYTFQQVWKYWQETVFLITKCCWFEAENIF